MDDNRNEIEEDGDYWCPDAPGEKCIKGYKRGWRKSKECRYCGGTNKWEWPPED